MRAYSSSGLSIDDIEIENILGIESETDTMDLESNNIEEFNHVYLIYKEPFEASREQIRTKLANLRNAK